MADGIWSLAEAKAKLSEVVERALSEGPQHITRHGRPAVVVLEEGDWRASTTAGKAFVEVLFDPSIRGLLTDEEAETLFVRDRRRGREIVF